MASVPPITYASTTRIGIGTTTPQASLDVVGDLSATAIPSVNYVGSKTFVFNPTNSTGRYFIGKITGGSMVKVQIFDSGYSHGCGLEATINLHWGNSTTNVPNITVSAGQSQLYEFYIQGTQNSGISYLWFNEKQDSSGNNITYIVKIFANGSMDLNTTDGLNGSAAALINRGIFNINGNVGIGTTAPKTDLHINGNITGSAIILYPDYPYSYRIERNGLDFRITGSSDSGTNRFIKIGYYGQDHTGGTFYERVLINTYTGQFQIQNASYGWRFGIGSSEFYIYRSIDATGVFIGWGGTGWTGNSDIRMKKNIKPLEYGLSEILALNPVRYNFKTDDKEDSSRLGFIAQEVKPILPEIVLENSMNGMYGITHTDMIPVMVKAIQEIKAEVESLKSQLAKITSIS